MKFAFLFLYIISSMSLENKPYLPTKHLPTQSPPNVSVLPSHVVFDLLALRNLNITQVIERLGKPNWSDLEPEESFSGTTQWYKIYRREGIELRIDYQRRIGNKVISFHVTPVGGVILEEKLDKFLTAVHLKRNSQGFRIKPIFLHQDPQTHRYASLMIIMQ